MAKRIQKSTEMTPEQMARYASELAGFGLETPSSDEEFLGGKMLEVCYEVSASMRVGQAIRRISDYRGKNAQTDRLIDTIIAQLRGEA